MWHGTGQGQALSTPRRRASCPWLAHHTSPPPASIPADIQTLFWEERRAQLVLEAAPAGAAAAAAGAWGGPPGKEPSPEVHMPLIAQLKVGGSRVGSTHAKELQAQLHYEIRSAQCSCAAVGTSHPQPCPGGLVCTCVPRQQAQVNYRTHSGILEVASAVVDALRRFFPLHLDVLARERAIFKVGNCTLVE